MAAPATMHPVLVEVPWPELGVPLWPAFLLLAAWGVVVAVRSIRRNHRFFALLGGLLALSALVLAFTTKGARLSAGPLEIRAWGVGFALSLVAGSTVAIARGRARGLERERVARASIAAALGAVVGARVLWVLLHPSAVGSIDGTLALYRGGLSAWGGIAGALAGTALSTRRSGTSLPELLDVAAPSFGVGVVLTRLGCYLEGCDFGVPLGAAAPRFLAALGTFPKGSPAWAEHVLSRALAPSATASLPVHPTELYEAVGGGALVALALWLERRQLRSGVVFGGVLLGYLLLRVSLDSFRDDPVEMWVSRALLALVLFGGTVATLSHFRSREK